MNDTTTPAEGNIYLFRYNDAERERLGYSATHCFEGILHARNINGSIELVDTFWGLYGDGCSYTEEEARQKGTLTYYVNLSEIEPIGEHECVYYDSKDLYRISEQHACVPRCVFHYKRKGAERSINKMLSVVNARILEKRRDVEIAIDKLCQLEVTKSKIENGDITQYL